MGARVSWTGDYVKDTQDMLSALGTFERMGIIHESKCNEFYYDLLGEFTDYYNPEEFDGDLALLIYKVS